MVFSVWGLWLIAIMHGVGNGVTKGVTGSHICWADRHCWISQRKVNARL
jgi:hypothetical protein